MKKTNLNYSPKDIPAQSKQAYFIKLFEMPNRFLNKIRWAAYQFDKKNEDIENKKYMLQMILISTNMFILQKDPDHNLIVFLTLKTKDTIQLFLII